MTALAPTLAPTAPPTVPPRTVVTATGGPNRRRCAVPGCDAVDDLWSMPGGAICRQHLLEHDARIYGADAVARRRDEAK